MTERFESETPSMDTILQGLEEGMVSAVKQARFHRTPVIIERDGKMQRVDPFTIPIPEDKLPNSINLNGE